jgi:hypothetical protein
MALQLTSPAFDHGARIPDQYGYTADDVNPPLEISGVPSEAETLALIVDDPDAVEPAGKVWDHWVVANVDQQTSEIPEDWTAADAVEGTNDYGDRGYGGPNPPDREHTYRFRVYALDAALPVGSGVTKDELLEAMEGHVLDEALLEGTYAP